MAKYNSSLASTLLAGGLSFWISGAAAAADLGGSIKDAPPPVAPFSWTGFYLGGNAGFAWAQADATSVTTDCQSPTGYYCHGGLSPSQNASAIAADGSGSLNSNEFTGGVQAGYNWHRGNWVLGGEIDFEAFNMTASRVAQGTYLDSSMVGVNYTVGSSVDTDWLFTARGRLGWAAGSALIYATGGVAITDLKTSNGFADEFDKPPGTAGASAAGASSDTKVGWVLGGGIELAMSRNWILRAEYLHVDFGSVNTTARVQPAPAYSGSSNSITTSTSLSADIVRGGISYKF